MINTPGIGRIWSEKRKNRLLEFEPIIFSYLLSFFLSFGYEFVRGIYMLMLSLSLLVSHSIPIQYDLLRLLFIREEVHGR